MKRLLSIFLSLLLAMGLVACAIAQPEPPATLPPSEKTQQPSPEPAQAEFQPGIYTAETSGFNGTLKLDVTFDEKGITGIDVVAHNETFGIGEVALPKLVAQAIEKQTLELDVVSGATLTSMGFVRGLTSAVEQAGVAAEAFKTPYYYGEVHGDVETDIVIVGSGSAGLSASLEAATAGMRVVLVEQLGYLGGTSLRAGYIAGAETQPQIKAGVEYSLEDHMAWAMSVDSSVDPGLRNEDTIKLWAERSGPTIDWLIEMGGVDLWDCERQTPKEHYPTGLDRIGFSLVPALQAKLEALGVDIRMETRADEILMDGDKAVGVRVEAQDGSFYNIHARAVILATGGYNASEEMVSKYNPDFVGIPYNPSVGADGSGMRMAEAVGAELAYMSEGSVFPYCIILGNAVETVGIFASRLGGAIAVNMEGNRYTNETGLYLLASKDIAKQTDGRSFMIMDQVSYDLTMKVDGKNLQQAVDLGKVPIADTPEELADLLGIDTANLRATMERYGELFDKGIDEDFGRDAAFFRSDLRTGPFYAFETLPSRHTNFGGIAVDTDTHVLRADKTPIAGLYAAGEVVATHTQGYSTNTQSVVFGRIAAQTAKEDLGI